MSAIRVCFVARSDFVSKPGGDTIQWQIYDAAARAAGMKTMEWFEDAPMPDARVFHALNVDRPLEIYPKMREAYRRGRTFIVSTVHHPVPWIERFRAVEPPGGSLGRVLYRSPLGRTVSRSESIKEIVRLAQQKRFGHCRDLWPSWSARVRWLLKNASRVMLLAREEEVHLRADFNADFSAEKTVVVPNWVEGVGEDRSADPGHLLKGWPEMPVLAVGRIEARKNVHRVAKLAERARRPILFLGRANPNEQEYVRQFENLVSASQYARWVPGVARPELSGYYQIASFLLNASYVEVSPMVDIEALHWGCPVATTQFALHHSVLPPGTPKCDPYNDDQILEILGWRPSRLERTEVVNPEDCRRSLISVYQSVAQRAPGSATNNGHTSQIQNPGDHLGHGSCRR
jgi:glycosyltransferase involved in cell wall biosynthesis